LYLGYSLQHGEELVPRRLAHFSPKDIAVAELFDPSTRREVGKQLNHIVLELVAQSVDKRAFKRRIAGESWNKSSFCQSICKGASSDCERLCQCLAVDFQYRQLAIRRLSLQRKPFGVAHFVVLERR
ncbi:hypothetical protein PFISCL1PPCAC_28653, partial [Pristionchus fissidentatus]